MRIKWLVLGAVGCGTFMATLDASIVNIALPTLTKDFRQDLYHVKWVVMIYLLMITCLILSLGKLSDYFGRKHVFILGFFIFILGSGLCGLAPDLKLLVIFRAIQALGAAMLMANGPAIITTSFRSTQRGTALGILSMIVSMGLLCGPALGGLLVNSFGWRSIFWLNIPIGVIGIFLTYSFIPTDFKILKKDIKKLFLNFDWLGSFVLIVCNICFILIFETSFTFISKKLLLLFFIFLSAFFYYFEARCKAPIFQTSLLNNSLFLKANIASFLSLCAFSSFSILMPFFLKEILRMSTQDIGFYMSIIPLTIFFVAPFSGKFSDQHGTLGVALLGTTIGIVSLCLMSGIIGQGLNSHTSHVNIILALMSMGLSIGLFQSPNNSAIMGSVPSQSLSSASALLVTFRNLGLVMGTSLATSLFSWRMKVTNDDFVKSFHAVLICSSLISFMALIVSLSRSMFLNIFKKKWK